MVVLRSPGAVPDALEQVLAWREKLAPLLEGFDYAALTLDGARALAMPEGECLNYLTPSRHVIKMRAHSGGS